MLIKLLILTNDKLVLNKFTINKFNNLIVIKSVECSDLIIKVPIYNKINGIDYYPLTFPLELPIYDNNIFNPYIILSSYNLNFKNNIDFFTQVCQTIKTNFELTFYSFEFIVDNPVLFGQIINEHYQKYITFEILKTTNNLNEFIKHLWNCINILKLFNIYVLIKYPDITNKNIKRITKELNLSKKLFINCNQIKSVKYNINLDYSDCLNHLDTQDNKMTFIEYYNFDFKNYLKLSDIKSKISYYIIVNKLDSSSTITTDITTNDKLINKVIKINVSKVKKNIIEVNSNNNILFENYKWSYYHPNLIIDSSYIIYQTFINQEFIINIIKNQLNLEEKHVFKILEYYLIDNKISNLLALTFIYDNIINNLSDLNIIKLNSYSDVYFEYIVKKYLDPDNIEPNNFIILDILFKDYNYPFKNNNKNFNKIFDYILYLSIYNRNNILIYNNINNIYVLHPNIIPIIPYKLKNVYINIIKFITQVINNNFESITYNQKFYSDYIHRNIINILLSNNTTSLSVILFKSLIEPESLNKIKKIVETNLLLIDISNKLSWTNISKKLNYLNVFYKNEYIVRYQNKLNKNIISDNFDFRIKKIIENPFEMYKYLSKEKDFIKWTKFISDRILQLYIIPVSISTEDFIHIGRLLFLLFNINEQNINDQSYINFIIFCNSHSKLIIESNRINLNIKEFFHNLKTNINLGFLAKHIISNKEIINFDKPVDLDNNLELLLKVKTKKYHKYKIKYLNTKNMSKNMSENMSETSSITPL